MDNTKIVRLALPFLVIALGGFANACSGNGDDGDDTSVNPPNRPPSGSGGGAGAGSAPAALCEVQDGDPAAMVAVPAGPFTMGCDPASDPECEPEEQPMHEVMLSAFEIDETEVTQDQYLACVADGACAAPNCDYDCDQPTLPASCITWLDSQDYCAWAGKRLPTEAEWEKAARGEDGRKFPWGDDPPNCDLANRVDCVGGMTPVGVYPAGASPYGALDMAGNMVEMVADRWDDDYYASSPAEDPQGPPEGYSYVGRGGGWRSTDKWLRNAERDKYEPEDQGLSLGFRCAR